MFYVSMSIMHSRAKRRYGQILKSDFSFSAHAYSVVGSISKQVLFLQLFDWSDSSWREITFYVYT